MQNLSHAEMYYICDKLYVYSLIHYNGEIH